MPDRLSDQQRDEVAIAHKGSLLDKLVLRARRDMHDRFLSVVKPGLADRILDIGASADPALNSSNFLEWACPELSIVAVGLGAPNPTWNRLYPNVPYVHGSALDLPFEDCSFDVVYSHAVIEHVGGFVQQRRMIEEAIRVSRREIWITTPNRWHPVEFHTALPFIHWLPKPVHRNLLRTLGLGHFASESTLNLIDSRSFGRAFAEACSSYKHKNARVALYRSRFMGLPANLLLHATLDS